MMAKKYKNILYFMSIMSFLFVSRVSYPMMRKGDTRKLDYLTTQKYINSAYTLSAIGTVPLYWKMFKVARSFSGSARFKAIGGIAALSAFQCGSWSFLHHKNDQRWAHEFTEDSDEWKK